MSLACAHAAAAAYDLPLYRYLGGVPAPDAAGADVQHPQRRPARPGLDRLPGVHGHARRRAPTFAEALRAGAEIFHALRGILHDGGHATGQGDEGGFAPSLPSNEAAVEIILRAIERAGYRPGDDVAIALDPATTELVEEGTGADGGATRYVLAREGRTLDPASWSTSGPTGRRATRSCRIEDGLAEDDWDGWRLLTERLGDTVQLVGDDLLVTNTERLGRASRRAPRTPSSSSSTRSAR